MFERIVIGGSGGQGVILIGKLLATVAVRDIPHVTFFPAYGAEVRGGASNCQVVLSSDEIASPVCEAFDSLLVMSQASADRFLPQAAAGAVTIYNSSLCSIPSPATGQAHGVAATEIAARLGDVRAANFVMLGAFLRLRPVVSKDAVADELRAALGHKGAALLQRNLDALRVGQECAE